MKLNIGIIGCGVIGEALKKWLSEHNKNCNLLISDPPKGFNDNIFLSDVFFISIHIPTEKDGSQDISLLKDIIKNLSDKPIFIRTTLIPGTTNLLRTEFKKNIYFMPEFLREKTAYEDFCSQPMIFCGEIDLLKKIFMGKKFEVMSSLEAEIAKYAHNVFCALKVTFFNGIYELAAKNNCDYDNIKKGLLISGNINENHINVPGYDDKFGYGGKCFPKDVNAFEKYTEKTYLGDLVKIINIQNDYYRKK